MRNWEDLDDSSFNEDNDEETNLCQIVDASTNKGEPTLDASSKDEDSQPEEIVNFDGEEAIFKSREDLIKGYSQLLFVFAHISKAYRKLNKRCSTSWKRAWGFQESSSISLS